MICVIIFIHLDFVPLVRVIKGVLISRIFLELTFGPVLWCYLDLGISAGYG